MLNRRTLLKFIGAGGATMPLEAVAKIAAEKQCAARREILILLSHVAGIGHYQQDDVIAIMQPGDELTLQRETFNQHDSNAIAVYRQSEKIGYVPRANNSAISLLIEEGTQLYAEIAWKDQDPWHPIGLAVSVVV